MWQCEQKVNEAISGRAKLTLVSNQLSPNKLMPTSQCWTERKKSAVQSAVPLNMTLKKLIVNCSQLLRRYEDANSTHRAIKRRSTNKSASPRRKLPKLVVPQPFILLENIFWKSRQRPQQVCKDEFLNYFQLNPIQMKVAPVVPGQRLSSNKLSQCANIPFSSDVGKIMAERENHKLSEEVKLKRLERSEWYVNKEEKTGQAGSAKADQDVVDPKEDQMLRDAHVFKPPKRQNHQHHPGLYDSDFLMRFCVPLTVKLERMDCKLGPIRKKPVVLIKESEQKRCDSVMKRSSSRLFKSL